MATGHSDREKTRREKTRRAPRSLVTGACGFMGSHMVEVLHAAGHEVVATDLGGSLERDCRKRGCFPSVSRELGVVPAPSDMRDAASLEPLTHDLDYVFHVASIFNYSTPWTTLHEVNVAGTRTLIELVLRNSPRLERFVVWGAGGVYGYPHYHEVPFHEDLPPAPTNDYLRSKWFQEHLVMQYGQQGRLDYTILRPTTVYGPRAVYGSGPLLMGPAEMPIVVAPANFTFRIPFVHVRDVVGAALYLSTTDDARNQIYNLNDDSRLSNIDFFSFVAEVTNRRFQLLPSVPLETLKPILRGVATALAGMGRFIPDFTPPLEADTVNYLGLDFLFDNKKLHEAGFDFRYPDPRPGLRETLEWYRDNGWISY